MANLHLCTSQSLQLLLQTLLLISKGFKCHDNLLDFILPLLKHFLHLLVLSVETFSLTSAVFLIATRVLYLTILDLDEFSQIVVLLLEGLVL